MDADAVRECLARAVKKAQGQNVFCDTHGISTAYVNDVLAGRRAPGRKILSALGLEKVISYRKAKS